MEGNWILESLIINHFTLNNIVRFRRISHMNEHFGNFFDNKNHLYINDNILTCMEIEILRFVLAMNILFLINDINLHTYVTKWKWTLETRYLPLKHSWIAASRNIKGFMLSDMFWQFTAVVRYSFQNIGIWRVKCGHCVKLLRN